MQDKSALIVLVDKWGNPFGPPIRLNGLVVEMRDQKIVSQKHYLAGDYHLDHDDLPAVIRQDGTSEWWIKGIRHRHGDLPAFTNNEVSVYYQHGVIHRDSHLGPAVIYSHPRRPEEHWQNGKRTDHQLKITEKIEHAYDSEDENDI